MSGEGVGGAVFGFSMRFFRIEIADYAINKSAVSSLFLLLFLVKIKS